MNPTVRKATCSILVFVAPALAASRDAWGISYDWNVATGDWSTPTNWLPVGEPGSWDTAYVDNGGTVRITELSEECEYLYLGKDSGESGTVEMSAGGLETNRNLYVGHDGSGTFTQTGGTNTVESELYLGYTSSSSQGAYQLSGSGVLRTGCEIVGRSGTGTFSQSGGTNQVEGLLYLGFHPGSSGRYDLAGSGELAVGGPQFPTGGGYEYIGHSGTGIFTQSGGTSAVAYRLYLGYDPGSEGTYQLSESGELSVTGHEYVGYSGIGTVTQTGGTHTIKYDLYLGYESDSAGTYHLSGSGELTTTREFVGYYGTGSFTQSGGTNTVHQHLYVGGASEGTYELSGTGVLSADTECIGYSSTGTFIQTGGANLVRSDMHLGRTSGSVGIFMQTGGTNAVVGVLNIGRGTDSHGIYQLGGSGELRAGTEYIGCPGLATFTHTGGTHMVDGSFYLARGATYQLSGTGELSAAEQYIGWHGAATFVQSEGSNTTGYLSLSEGSTYTLTAGTLKVTSSASVLGSLDFAGGSGSVSAGGLVNLGMAALNSAGATTMVVNPDSLLIVPAGFDPATEFGTFVNNGLVLQRGSTVVIPSGKGFSGRGVVEGHIDCRGTIHAAGGPIDLIGGLHVLGAGNVDLDSGTLAVEDTSSGISGGELTAREEYVGYDGTGTFIQAGGTNAVGRDLYIGYHPGASGTFTQCGGMNAVTYKGEVSVPWSH